MNIKIISVTSSEIGSAEDLIVYTARVSNPENQNNFETSEKLLNFLAKHKHWSPFEMADMTVEIKTSRAIAAQILRHRSFSFQEFSQRYSEATEVELLELRYKAETNRQSSSNAVSKEHRFYNEIERLQAESFYLYNEMLNHGIAKECARGILPLNTQTTMYMKGSVRSWIHYLQIRTAENTQLEHREIALSILEIFRKEFPIISKSLF